MIVQSELSESERLRSSVRRLAMELGGTRGLGAGDGCYKNSGIEYCGPQKNEEVANLV